MRVQSLSVPSPAKCLQRLQSRVPQLPQIPPLPLFRGRSHESDGEEDVSKENNVSKFFGKGKAAPPLSPASSDMPARDSASNMAFDELPEDSLPIEETESDNDFSPKCARDVRNVTLADLESQRPRRRNSARYGDMSSSPFHSDPALFAQNMQVAAASATVVTPRSPNPSSSATVVSSAATTVAGTRFQTPKRPRSARARAVHQRRNSLSNCPKYGGGRSVVSTPTLMMTTPASLSCEGKAVMHSPRVRRRNSLSHVPERRARHQVAGVAA